MDLDFTEEQQMIRDMARAMFEEHSDVDAVRALEFRECFDKTVVVCISFQLPFTFQKNVI